MSTQAYLGRRGELLAELFFQELNPVFVSRPTQDVGYDLLVGFANDNAGINSFAVEVKCTEKPLGSHFPIQRSTFNRIAHSNVPGLLLVADVKRNQLYYGWLRGNGSKGTGAKVLVPIVELDESSKKNLKKQLGEASHQAAAAG